jgi:hypothetical protein
VWWGKKQWHTHHLSPPATAQYPQSSSTRNLIGNRLFLLFSPPPYTSQQWVLVSNSNTFSTGYFSTKKMCVRWKRDTNKCNCSKKKKSLQYHETSILNPWQYPRKKIGIEEKKNCFEKSNIFHPTPKWRRRFPRTTQRRRTASVMIIRITSGVFSFCGA